MLYSFIFVLIYIVGFFYMIRVWYCRQEILFIGLNKVDELDWYLMMFVIK